MNTTPKTPVAAVSRRGMSMGIVRLYWMSLRELLSEYVEDGFPHWKSDLLMTAVIAGGLCAAGIFALGFEVLSKHFAWVAIFGKWTIFGMLAVLIGLIIFQTIKNTVKMVKDRAQEITGRDAQ